MRMSMGCLWLCNQTYGTVEREATAVQCLSHSPWIWILSPYPPLPLFSLLSVIMPFFYFVLTHSERVSCFTCFTCRFGLVCPISKIAAECCTWGLALLFAGELHVIRAASKSCCFVIKSGCLFWKVPVWWKSNSSIREHVHMCILCAITHIVTGPVRHLSHFCNTKLAHKREVQLVEPSWSNYGPKNWHRTRKWKLPFWWINL